MGRIVVLLGMLGGCAAGGVPADDSPRSYFAWSFLDGSQPNGLQATRAIAAPGYVVSAPVPTGDFVVIYRNYAVADDAIRTITVGFDRAAADSFAPARGVVTAESADGSKNCDDWTGVVQYRDVPAWSTVLDLTCKTNPFAVHVRFEGYGLNAS